MKFETRKNDYSKATGKDEWMAHPILSALLERLAKWS